MSAPLKGMPFDRIDLAKATRRAFDEAKRIRPGKVISGVWVQPITKPIGWAEARNRGYRHLIFQHFPDFMRRQSAGTDDGQGTLPSV